MGHLQEEEPWSAAMANGGGSPRALRKSGGWSSILLKLTISVDLAVVRMAGTVFQRKIGQGRWCPSSIRSIGRSESVCAMRSASMVMKWTCQSSVAELGENVTR